jgi:excisionase family DNA binding protein
MQTLWRLVANEQKFERLMDDAEAAEFLGGLHPKTVQRMARRGDLPAYRIGKYWRYRASELDAWIQLQSTRHNPSVLSEKENIQ